MSNIWNWLTNNIVIVILGTVTLIQITPIKINPWTWILKQFKNGLGITDISSKIEVLEKDITDEKVSRNRWDILDFGNSCRQGRSHTKEEWDHCLEELRWYEQYCLKHNVTNGVMHEMAGYLRAKYSELLHNNGFLI